MSSRIRPSWTPSQESNAGAFTFGFAWSADIAITVDGLYWYQTGGDPPASVTARLYTNAGTELASGTNSSLSAGWNFVAFSVPYAASSGTTYRAAMESTGTHGYDSPAGFPITDPTGHVTIPSNGGRYDSGHVFPTTSWDGLHGVDLSFIATVDGTLAVTAPAATASLSGDVTAQGALAATAPAGVAVLVGEIPVQGVLTASAPPASVALTGDQPVQGVLTASAPAGVASLAGTNATVTLGRLLAMQTTTVTIYEPSSIDEWSGERTADTLVASAVPASVIEQGRTVNDPKTRTARVVRQVTGRVPDGAPVTTDSRIVDGEGRTYAVRSVRQPRNPLWIGDVILELLRTDQAPT